MQDQRRQAARDLFGSAAGGPNNRRARGHHGTADFNGDRPRQGPGKPPQLFLDALEKASADAIRTAGITGLDDPEAIRKAA